MRKLITATIAVLLVYPTSTMPSVTAAETIHTRSCANATSNGQYDKYIKAHNSMCISYADDEVIVEVTYFKISYWYFSGWYPNESSRELNTEIKLFKDGVPVGEAERTDHFNSDRLTVRVRFPALSEGKYTATLKDNLVTTNQWNETLTLSGKMDNPLFINPFHEDRRLPLLVACQFVVFN